MAKASSPEGSEASPLRPPRHTSSKYDFVKVKVWLGEGGSHYYVLSRFLVSRMLTVTRIPAVVAIKIALELKKLLVDASLLDVSQADLEENLFVLMRRRGFGDEYINRYKMMTRFHHQRVPLIILVCGTACVGKSTIATQLAQRLNLPNVLQTDIVYELLRTSVDAPLSRTPVWAHEFDSSQDLIAEFRRECRIVHRGLEGDLGKAVRDGKPIIIEGEHLDPSIFLQTSSQPADATSATRQKLPNGSAGEDGQQSEGGHEGGAQGEKRWAASTEQIVKEVGSGSERSELGRGSTIMEEVAGSAVGSAIMRTWEEAPSGGDEGSCEGRYTFGGSYCGDVDSGSKRRNTDSESAGDLQAGESHEGGSRSQERGGEASSSGMKGRAKEGNAGNGRSGEGEETDTLGEVETAEKQKKRPKPIIVPIVLKMDEDDHLTLLAEWRSYHPMDGNGQPEVDDQTLLKRLRIIQDYLCSFEEQGVAVVNVSATTFSKALDWIHAYLLQQIEQGCTPPSA